MNNQIKCDFCGLANPGRSERCIKCYKNLGKSASIRSSTESRDVNLAAKRIFFILLASAGAYLLLSFLIIDKTSRTSLFERQFYQVTAPDPEIIRHAVFSRINAGYKDSNVLDPGYSGTTTTCGNGSWQTSAAGVHDFRCTNSVQEFDRASFKPMVVESFSAKLKSYEILSAEVSTYSYPKDIPGFEDEESYIRYKAAVKVDQDRIHSVSSSMPDPQRDFQKIENQITETFIALKWNPKAAKWEISTNYQ